MDAGHWCTANRPTRTPLHATLTHVPHPHTSRASELFNYIDIPVKEIHGKQKQAKRTATFFEFCQADKGILLCTGACAWRGG
jgi:hypothetical protein